MKNDPKIFAVVLNYNGYEDTVKCIESLIKVKYSNLQLIIVDNASTDGSGALLQRKYPDIHYIFSSINNGYAAGMNCGIKYSLKNYADFILLVNNDTIVSPNFLEPMITEMNDDNVGIVSGKVYYRDNPEVIYCAGGKFDFVRCTGMAQYQGKNGDEYANEKREISLAEGCFMMVRKEVFEKIGLFEEKYFMYWEDLEFSARVRKHFKIIYNNKSIIYHKSGAGKAWDEFTSLYSYYYTRNRLWYFYNYSYPYRLYVIIFSVLVAFLKSLKMLQSYIRYPSKRHNLLKSLLSLWKGLKDGILLILKIKKIINNS